MTTPRRAVTVCVATLTLWLAAGCGGGRVRLTDRLTPDPAVAWVFDAGMELALNWWIVPAFEPGWIGGSAHTDGKIVLLCNLGGASEALTASRAYVLDVNTGRVVKKIHGPTQTYWDDWLITPDLAYVRTASRDGWVAFDLQDGRVLWDPPDPGQSALPRPTRFPYEQVEYDRSTGLRRYRCSLGNGRVVVIAAKPFGWATFDLTWEDAAGVSHTRRLCRLPNRPSRGGDNYVIVDNERRLVFSWSEYAICVDLRRLVPATEWKVRKE